ncbi:MAG: Mut7-C RNAse domain-containing protein [Ignisphaera sp.]
MSAIPRFIADAMLGHVARWLRLLGYDTLYYKSINDWKLLKIAKEEDRILLTRDLGLFRRARRYGIRALFIEDPSIEKVLAFISVKYSISLEFNKDNTLCPECNTRLKYTTSITEISVKVNKDIALKYREFWICPSCSKIYWQGNHWRTISSVLEEARQEKLKILSKIKPLERKIPSEGASHSEHLQ